MISTLYEPFRHWSEGGSVFILSDTHFDDADCKLMDPNWITPEEQVRIINSVVGKGDTFVYWLILTAFIVSRSIMRWKENKTEQSLLESTWFRGWKNARLL